MGMIRVQAQHLQLGDVVGSGEVVESVSAGTRTPTGKIEIGLCKDNKFRISIWGKYTMIGIQDRKPVPNWETDFKTSPDK